jgi:hypothetical protein
MAEERAWDATPSSLHPEPKLKILTLQSATDLLEDS